MPFYKVFSRFFYFYLFSFLSRLPLILRKFEDYDHEIKTARPYFDYRVSHLPGQCWNYWNILRAAPWHNPGVWLRFMRKIWKFFSVNSQIYYLETYLKMCQEHGGNDSREKVNRVTSSSWLICINLLEMMLELKIWNLNIQCDWPCFFCATNWPPKNDNKLFILVYKKLHIYFQLIL